MDLPWDRCLEPAGHQPVGRYRWFSIATAQLADGKKEEFFSHISGELRTPLTSVANSASDFALQGIVKGRVDAHGGPIQVESEEGRESRFLVGPPRDGGFPVGAARTGSEP